MSYELTVTRQPALARLSDPVTAGRGHLRDALRELGDTLVADLATRSSGAGTIPQGWQREVQDAGAELVLVLTNRTPGARYLDKGATWPGPMPPWKDPGFAAWYEAHGIPPFVGARALQRKGLKARNWTKDVMAAHRGEIAQVGRVAVQRWLRGGGG